MPPRTAELLCLAVRDLHLALALAIVGSSARDFGPGQWDFRWGEGDVGYQRVVTVWEPYEALNRVMAQQVVNSAVDGWMGESVHTMSMKTFPPEDCAERD